MKHAVHPKLMISTKDFRTSKTMSHFPDRKMRAHPILILEPIQELLRLQEASLARAHRSDPTSVPWVGPQA